MAPERPLHVPPELVARVVSYLAELTVQYEVRVAGSYNATRERRIPLAPYAGVSRTWQACVEEHTFAKLRLDPARLARAQSILTPARLVRVRHVTAELLLPEYHQGHYSAYETPFAQQRNTEVFSDGMRALHAALAGWGPHLAPGGIVLELVAYSPSDWGRQPPDVAATRRLAMENSASTIISRMDFGTQRWARSHLGFEGPALPATASGVRELRVVGRRDDRKFHPDAVGRMLVGFPALRTLRILLDEKQTRLGDRLEHRRALAGVLLDLPATVQELELRSFYRLPYLETADAPSNLLPNNARVDPLSAAVRTVSSRLTTLSIDRVILGLEVLSLDPRPALSSGSLPGAVDGPSDPSSPLEAAPEQSWPRLRSIHLHNPFTVSLDGSWKLKLVRVHMAGFRAFDDEEESGTDGEGEDPSMAAFGGMHLMAYSRPDPLFLQLVYVAAARAARRMPALRDMVVTTSNSGDLALNHTLLAALVVDVQQQQQRRARVTFVSPRRDRPGAEVRDAWAAALGEERGLEVEFAYLSFADVQHDEAWRERLGVEQQKQPGYIFDETDEV